LEWDGEGTGGVKIVAEWSGEGDDTMEGARHAIWLDQAGVCLLLRHRMILICDFRRMFNFHFHIGIVG